MLGTTDHKPFLHASEELALPRDILDIFGNGRDAGVHRCDTRSTGNHETPGCDELRAQTAAGAEGEGQRNVPRCRHTPNLTAVRRLKAGDVTAEYSSCNVYIIPHAL